MAHARGPARLLRRAACVTALLVAVVAWADNPFAPPGASVAAAQPAEAVEDGGEEAGQAEVHVAEEHAAEEAHGESALAFVSRVLNFAVLAGGLVYLLRRPLSEFLAAQQTAISAELTEAARVGRDAEAQLASIDAKLAAVPGELDTLRRRGAEEIAAEEVRIGEAAAAERDRLSAQMRREIDLAVRARRRELLELGAGLATDAARAQLERRLDPDVQLGLVDRYAMQLGGER